MLWPGETHLRVEAVALDSRENVQHFPGILVVAFEGADVQVVEGACVPPEEGADFPELAEEVSVGGLVRPQRSLGRRGCDRERGVPAEDLREASESSSFEQPWKPPTEQDGRETTR